MQELDASFRAEGSKFRRRDGALAIVGLKAINYAKPEYQVPSRPDAHADKRQSQRGRIGKNNQ
jgi:hypothetical protein